MKRAAEVVRTYLGLLEGGLAARTATWLTDESRARELFHHGRQTCTTLLPLFLDGDVYRGLLAATEQLMHAVDVAVACLWSDAAARRRYLVPERFDPLLAAPDPTPAIFPARPDAFIDATGTVRFLEINPIPGGYVTSLQLGELFLEAPPLAHPALRDATVRYDSTLGPMRSLLAGLRARIATTGSLRIGVVGDRSGHWELAIVDRLCAQLGAELVWSLPGEVTVDGDRAIFSGVAVDCVMLGHPVKLGPDPIAHPLVAATLRGAPIVHLRGLGASVLLGRKSLFALLTDDAFVAALPSELARTVRTHVPWTRVLRDERTTDPSQAPIELLAYARATREQLVLKPTSTQGGEGIVRGWTVSAGDWDAALATGLARPHVLQARVDGGLYPVPLWRDGQLEIVERIVDFNPFVWEGGRAAGVFSRWASESGLTNVAVGGGCVPCLSVE